MNFLSTLVSSIAPAGLSWPAVADAVAKASLLLALAGAATSVLRRAPASVRHLVWTLALVSSVVVPALSSTLPRWEVPLVRIAPAQDGAVAPQTAADTPAPIGTDAAAEPAPVFAEMPAESAPLSSAVLETSPASPPAFTWQAALLGIWLIGFLTIIGRLLLGMLAVQWMSRHTETVTDAPWLPLARRLAASLGVSPRVRFLRSRATTMPMAWGILNPAVLMPADADRWPTERLRIVLLHELAHVRRRDCLTHLFAQAACAVHWFNPLAWVAARHARAERERACDDLVLTSGTGGPEYAEELLLMARAARGSRFPTVLAGATLAMAHRSQLEGRLMAILDPAIPRAGLTRVGAVAASLACVCTITPLAAIQPWSEAPQSARAEPAVATKDLSPVQLPNVPTR